MFGIFPAGIRGELEDLSRRFGSPRVCTQSLSISKLFDPLDNDDRYGEVCMVVRRPSGRVLTAVRTF